MNKKSVDVTYPADRFGTCFMGALQDKPKMEGNILSKKGYLMSRIHKTFSFVLRRKTPALQ